MTSIPKKSKFKSTDLIDMSLATSFMVARFKLNLASISATLRFITSPLELCVVASLTFARHGPF